MQLVFVAFWTWFALKWVGIGAGILAGGGLGLLVYLAVVVAWQDQQTNGNNYYGRQAADRRRFKRWLGFHSALLGPVLWLMSRGSREDALRRGTFDYKGVAAPRGICDAESFRRAEQYEPSAQDVFVVTQMKCGTTWMQHLVYQVLTRGGGDLVGQGVSLFAVSPWLESRKTRAPQDAPLVGEASGRRIIKTHLPVELCPFDERARYVYVARHPLSCFASCVDYLTSSLGYFAPSVNEMEHWFQSEQAWWGTWAAHVSGWWERAQQHENVIFVTFEEMKSELGAVAARLAEMLEIEPLERAELDAIVAKCGFAYMSQHADAFEMNPPHLVQSASSWFVSGRTDRHHDIPEATRLRLAAWCRESLQSSRFPLARFYPDLVAGSASAEAYETAGHD